jgi:hypothetical protein
LQVAPFENDAAPSRPVLYKILETKKGWPADQPFVSSKLVLFVLQQTF